MGRKSLESLEPTPKGQRRAKKRAVVTLSKRGADGRIRRSKGLTVELPDALACRLDEYVADLADKGTVTTKAEVVREALRRHLKMKGF